MDPQSRPGEFSPAGEGGLAATGCVSHPAAGPGSEQAGCTFSGAVSHDRFCGGQEPGGKVSGVGSGRLRCYRPPRWTRRETEDACRVARLRAVRVRSTWASLPPAVRPNRASRSGPVAPPTPRVSGESVGPPPDPS